MNSFARLVMRRKGKREMNTASGLPNSIIKMPTGTANRPMVIASRGLTSKPSKRKSAICTNQVIPSKKLLMLERCFNRLFPTTMPAVYAAK